MSEKSREIISRAAEGMSIHASDFGRYYYNGEITEEFLISFFTNQAQMLINALRPLRKTEGQFIANGYMEVQTLAAFENALNMTGFGGHTEIIRKPHELGGFEIKITVLAEKAKEFQAALEKEAHLLHVWKEFVKIAEW